MSKMEELKGLDLTHIAGVLRVFGQTDTNAFPSERRAMINGADLIEAQAAEIERLRTDVLRVVDGARPYRDESGIIEIPLHTFGLLWRIADEARAALQSDPAVAGHGKGE